MTAESHDKLAIAIDGPSASGKSTVSKRVAEVLQLVYVDSGALYRGLTWKVLREQVDPTDGEQVISLMKRINWEFYVDNRVVGFRIDGEDPGQQIRSEPVRESVSDVATIPEVRAFLVQSLQRMTQFGALVMEGRDIGTVVFPGSPMKFYLDADPEERARRRHREIEEVEGGTDVQEILQSLTKRDKKDSSRTTAPLQIALGAQVINSTSLGIEEVVEKIVGLVRSSGYLPEGSKA